MTDSRPEITANDRGQFVVVTLRRTDSCGVETFEEVPLSAEEAFMLQCQLCTAQDKALENMDRQQQLLAEDAKAAGPMAIANNAKSIPDHVWDAIEKLDPHYVMRGPELKMSQGLKGILENEPIILEAFRNEAEERKSWRDRESML